MIQAIVLMLVLGAILGIGLGLADKYLKVEVNDAIKVTTWNMTKQKFTTLNNDLEVILYSCKSIYTPKLETDVKKEDNNEP